MPVFDTSALVPLFIPDHAHHEEAKRRFNAAESVILHPSVVAEFTTVLRRLVKKKGSDGNKKARQALLALLREPRVSFQADMNYEDVVELYVSLPKISFTDAVVSESISHYDKTQPVTFDDRAGSACTLSKKERSRRRKNMESGPSEL